MPDKNSNTSCHNFESETDFPGFSTIEAFDMKPSKKVSDKNYTQC